MMLPTDEDANVDVEVDVDTLMMPSVDDETILGCQFSLRGKFICIVDTRPVKLRVASLPKALNENCVAYKRVGVVVGVGPLEHIG